MAVRKITLWVANERIELNIDTEKERYFREAEEEIEKKIACISVTKKKYVY
jgi:hypothetical protein